MLSLKNPPQKAPIWQKIAEHQLQRASIAPLYKGIRLISFQIEMC
jgi:hypothetical protein